MMRAISHVATIALAERLRRRSVRADNAKPSAERSIDPAMEAQGAGWVGSWARCAGVDIGRIFFGWKHPGSAIAQNEMLCRQGREPERAFVSAMLS